MTAAEIAAGLNGRRNGKGWIARCPAHNDKHPSLSIDEGRDGKALVVCRAGCSQEQVIDALRGRGLWHEPSGLHHQVRIPSRAEPAPGQGQDTKSISSTDVEQFLPVPTTSPPPDFAALLGTIPTDTWDYLDADGRVLGYVARVDRAGKKDVYPVTWCRGPNGTPAWRLKAFPEPRPLYGLAPLAERPDAPVLIVEGEKVAVAASKLFDDFVVMTWSGGCGAVGKADWRVLDGRKATVWPDADEPGIKAASEVVARVPASRVVMLPEGLPKGWDLADDIPEGMDVDLFLADAQVPPDTVAVEAAPPIILTYPSEWTDPPPPRKWLAEGWIPWGTVTAMYGDGGMGKSLLCQQLLTCAASNNEWLGLPVTQVKSLAVFCEDPKGEHRRRQWDINHLYGTSPADIADMAFMHRFGEPNNAMMIFPHRDAQGEATVFYRQVLNAAQEFGAKLVLLDSLHNLFSGDENARPQALQFIQALCSIAIKLDGVVVLTGHPSLSGMSSGSGTSGSTAWSNAVRSRLYLSRPEKQGSDDVDPNEKVLRVMKANYAPVGDGIRLTWANGVLNYHPEEMGVDATARAAKASRVFMALFAETADTGENMSPLSTARNYAPKMFSRRSRKDRESLTQKDFEGALRRATRNGDIQVVEYGPPSNLKKRLEMVPKEPK